MIPIFVCTTTLQGEKSMRRHMLDLCMSRWSQEPGVKLTIISPNVVGRVENHEFQRKRRIMAEMWAESDIYVCADDDCLPESEPFVEKAVEILSRHANYGILCPWPNNSILLPWTPHPTEWVCKSDEEVMEHVSVGGIRFCRRGVLPEWPEMLPGVEGYDSLQCGELRRLGYSSGFYRGILMNHLGRGYSTCWKPTPMTDDQLNAVLVREDIVADPNGKTYWEK